MSSSAATAPDHSETGHPRRWFILGVLVLSLLVVVLDNTVLNVAMRTIADPNAGLGASQGQLEWAVNSYTLVFAGLLFTFGVLGDRIGRKRMLLIGLALFGVTSLASAFAQDPTQLIWARAGMGIGAAAIMPSTLSILSTVFSPRERARAIGIWSGAVGIGIAIGPIVGGALLQHFWWGSVFLINVPVVAVALLAIALVAPESRTAVRSRIDVIGVGLSMVGLVGLTYGIIHGGETSDWGRFTVWGPLLGGIVVLGLFVLYESRIDQPALDVRLFKGRRFSSATAVIALVFFGGMGLMFFMTFYIQIVKGFTPLETGLLFLPFAAAMLIFAPLSSAAVKRFGPRAVAVSGMTAISVAFIGYQLLEADTPVGLMCVLFFVQGAGMANVMPPAMETIMASVPRDKSGVGSAVGNTVRQVGGSMGIAVLGSLLSQMYRDDITDRLPAGLPEAASESIASTYGVAQQMGDAGRALIQPATESFITSMHITALVSAGVAIIGVVVAVTLFPKRHTETATPGQEPATPEPVLVDA